jgi:hypothetical protein
MENFSIEPQEGHHDYRRADKLNLFSEKGLCWLEWPDEPWNIKYYFSSRGNDNFHIYLWIVKDLAWIQNWFWIGHVFGGLAMLWTWFIILKCFWNRERTQAWISLSQFFWLCANFLWMSGELHDSKYPNDKSVYHARNKDAGYMLITALVMISTYYLVVLPYQRLIYRKKESFSSQVPSYDPTSNLSTRCPSLFSRWTDYENIHILFWLGKDAAWNLRLPAMWAVFMVPTLLVGSDFAWKTLFKKRLVIDHAHYLAQLFWVLSNAAWAGVELFFPDNHRLDKTVDLLPLTSDALHSGRWYASWVLMVACLPPLELSLRNRLLLYESIMPEGEGEEDYALPAATQVLL